MRKFHILIIIVAILSLVGCYKYSPQFAPESKIDLIQKHVVAVTVTYPNDQAYYPTDDPYRMFLGAGVIIEGNKILTVAHLFDHGDFVKIDAIRIWGWNSIEDGVIGCKLIYMAERNRSTDSLDINDYAILEMEKDLGLPGLRIADTDLRVGEKAIFAGSVGGMCITRCGFCTYFKYFFHRNDQRRLELTQWADELFITVYPGGNGDSGGTICNIRGEIVGVMYAGVENHAESYIFSNKLDKLKAFLQEAKEFVDK